MNTDNEMRHATASRVGRLARVGAVASIALIAALPAIPAGAQGSPSYAIHMLGMRGTSPTKNASGSTNLIDHGGTVLPASDTYAIFWGPSGAWASDVQPGIASFFGALNGSSFLNIATQYMRGTSATSTWKGSMPDASSPPNSNRVSPSVLGAEVQKIYGTNVDPNGVYFVYTSNFPKGGNYCAWHSYAKVGSVTISVAYMPNTTNVAGCNPGAPTSLHQSEGLSSLVNVTSHEFMESITDQAISAWYDSSGSEIGDKCAWNFAGVTSLHGGSSWYLQQEWSNAITGCAISG